MAIALYSTYSRAALIGGFVIAIVIAWRVRRQVGAIVLTGGIVLGLCCCRPTSGPRGEVLGPESGANPGELFVTTDAYRLRAWEAPGRM